MLVSVWLWRALPLRRALSLAAVSGAAALTCMGPWIARNAITFGEFIPTSAKGGLTFYLGTVSTLYSEPAIVRRLGVTSTRHPAAHDEMWLRLGLRNVRAHPLRWLGFDVGRIYHQYGQENLLLYWGRVSNSGARRVALLYWLAIVALALIGIATMIAGGRRTLAAWWLIAGSIAAVSLMQICFSVEQRQRLPLTYLLILLAGRSGQRLADLAFPPARRAPQRSSGASRAQLRS